MKMTPCNIPRPARAASITICPILNNLLLRELFAPALTLFLLGLVALLLSSKVKMARPSPTTIPSSMPEIAGPIEDRKLRIM